MRQTYPDIIGVIGYATLHRQKNYESRAEHDLRSSSLKPQRLAALRPESSDVTTKENSKCAEPYLLV